MSGKEIVYERRRNKIIISALSQILANQNDIKKHLGPNKLDSEYGWNDEDTMKLSRKCSETANDFEHNDNDFSNYW